MIGSHHNESYSGPGGKYYKSRYHRAARRYAKAKLRAQAMGIKHHERGFMNYLSELDWRGT